MFFLQQLEIEISTVGAKKYRVKAVDYRFFVFSTMCYVTYMLEIKKKKIKFYKILVPSLNIYFFFFFVFLLRIFVYDFKIN